MKCIEADEYKFSKINAVIPKMQHSRTIYIWGTEVTT
jgi:hypothetical protein